MSSPDYGNSEYMYGVEFQGRGPFTHWYDNKADAKHDAETTDDKYLPAELLRIPLSAIERSGLFLEHDEEWTPRWTKKTS